MHRSKICALPDIPGYAESSEEKLALARVWLRCWKRYGNMAECNASRVVERKKTFQPSSGNFEAAMRSILHDRHAQVTFRREWVPELLNLFTSKLGARNHRLRGSELSLAVGGDLVILPIL